MNISTGLIIFSANEDNCFVFGFRLSDLLPFYFLFHIYFSSLGVLSSEYPNIIPDFCEKSMNSQYTLIGDFCVIYVRK